MLFFTAVFFIILDTPFHFGLSLLPWLATNVINNYESSI